MDLNKKYSSIQASNLGHEWTTSIPFKTKLILDHLEDVTSNDKKIEIVSWVLHQLCEKKYSKERWWLDDKYKIHEEEAN